MTEGSQHTTPQADSGPHDVKPGAAAGRFLVSARTILDAIERTQMEAIAAAADICAGAIGAGGFVHLFGTGHSRIPLEEAFPRYGSYPGFHPIAELSMTFHTQVAGANGQRQAMFIERTEGLAAVILSNFHVRPTDAMVIFSAGGVTAVPIEMAMTAHDRGLQVIAVTAVEQSRISESGHSSGTRLLDHADIVIDLCTPVGDATVWLEGVDTPIGPGSTIANAAIVNELKVQTAQRLHLLGQLPPVLTSSSVVGAERSAELFEAAYRDHAKRLAHALGGDG
jgi:uncharacterized phosphosugar-binding protein